MTGYVDPMDWFPDHLYWSRIGDAPTGLCEEHRSALRDVDGDPSFSATALGR
jgi:hypothetical protein